MVEKALPVSVAKAPAGPRAVRATLVASSSAPFPGGEMSGLSHLESEGCRNLLGMLDNDEIMALCDTVTNRLVQPVDRQGRRRRGCPGSHVNWSGREGRLRPGKSLHSSPASLPTEPGPGALVGCTVVLVG